MLATSIAETSLTIEGVRVVIDSGLMRVPRYEPDIGLTRLETVRVSKANADQRRGRAGRVEPGICYRLWEEAANGGLAPYAAPEILSADLSGFLLDCAAWGVADPGQLAFLDPPPRGALQRGARASARHRRARRRGRITDEGRAIARLALPPRLARMVVDAARDRRRADGERGRGRADRARPRRRRGRPRGPARSLPPRPVGARRRRAAAGARLGGKGRGGPHPAPRIKSGGRAAFSRKPEKVSTACSGRGEGAARSTPGPLLAAAYPDRIAMARGRRGEFLMANGRAAALEPHEALAAEPFLAIGEIAGRAASARILLAAALGLEEIEAVAGGSIETTDELAFDRASAALRARRRRRLGALVLAEQTLAVPPDEASALALALGVLSLGLERLPWSKGLRQWRDRVMFLRRAEDEAWPDLSDAALASDPQWLAPFLIGKTRLDEIGPDDLSAALRTKLPFALARRLDEEAPTHFLAPTGTAAPIDYTAEGGPCDRAPRAGIVRPCPASHRSPGGRIPLTLQLLSPAQRPIQITRDLPGFWRGSWAAVRSDLRGRYPRHFWPEDPASAAPTARAKPRGT